MRSIQEALPLLQEPKKIFITTHHKPDGDALGSSLGLYHFLIQLGHSVTVVSPSEAPDFLLWLPGMDTVLNYESEPRVCQKKLAEADLVFCLDFNRLDRIKAMEEPLKQAIQPKILIDHHLQPDEEAFAYGMSNAAKSSTCEMVYDFIMLANGAPYLNDNIARCLYTGLMTDTGSFRFPATTASVHEIIADFKRRGLNHSPIHEEVYDTWSLQRMRFLGFVLKEKMEVVPGKKYGIIALSQEDMKQFNVNTGDTEGLVNYPLSIKGVLVAVMISERKDEVKLSFRSKGNIDVSTFARTYFNGGGHFNAAGGSSDLSLEATVKKVRDLIVQIIP